MALLLQAILMTPFLYLTTLFAFSLQALCFFSILCIMFDFLKFFISFSFYSFFFYEQSFWVKQFKGLRSLQQLSLCTANPPITLKLQRLLRPLHPIVIIFLAPWLHCSICREQKRAGLEGLWVSCGSVSGIFPSLGPITTHKQSEHFALWHEAPLLHEV